MAMSFFLAIFSFFLVIFRNLGYLLWSRKSTETMRFHRPPLAVPIPPSRPPSPSRSGSVWKYDVFLSFRGKDVRRSFLSHLYRALTGNGIHVFRDDKELKRGNLIGPGLLEAIEESRFAIVVISENYANSQWCLEELSHIIHLAGMKRLELIPIFYGIDVKMHNRRFEKDFAEHELRFGVETVERWRKALAQIGKISGWNSSNWVDESELIEELVQDLSNRLFMVSPSESGKMFGMNSHMRKIQPLLHLNSEDVRMVGIWGMGGIGKTTVAKFVFQCIRNKFHGVCLLENVKGEFIRHGPSHLREKIISKIVRRSISYNDCGAMKHLFRNRKVLLVLDNVDNIEQLQELAGSSEWFGPGSRIIVTTRDRRVLDQHDVEYIYEVKPLMTAQALELFSNHAFKRSCPHEDFRELSINFVDQLGCLPLALKVIGASLYRRDLPYWEDKLLILKNNLDNSISKVLRESYDALDKQEKIVFLYVACCFNGENVDEVKEVLERFVASPRRQRLPCMPRIMALIEKCLIIVSKEKRLYVHDLLQDLARDIICEEEKPTKRRILWDFEDINYVLSENAGPEAIEVESIFLNITGEKELHINRGAFKKMFNVKLLKFYDDSNDKKKKISMPHGLDYLPMLSYLHWDAYNLKSLPTEFCTEYLVELNLPNSSVKTLWNGTQELVNLRRMNLSGCSKLVEIPDLSKAINLEKLKLSHCKSLVKLHSSIESIVELWLDGTAIEEVPKSIECLSRLASLHLTNCKRLKNLPDAIKNIDSLICLRLADCPNITIFPKVGSNIESLVLNRTAIEEVPLTIFNRSRLMYLNMEGCKRLKNLPQMLRNQTDLKFIFCCNFHEAITHPKIGKSTRASHMYKSFEEVTDSMCYSNVVGLAKFMFRTLEI